MRISKSSPEEFGTGSFAGDIMEDPSFFDMSAADQARFLGQRAGCPVVEELITDRGSEKMVTRYAEINFWYGFVSREIDHYNQPLFAEFSKATPRKEGESAGKYEPKSVPDNYTQTIAPINSLPGFSLPRMMIEQIQSGEDKARRQQKLVNGLQIIENAIKESKTSVELMARVAEGLIKDGAGVDKIIKQMLGQGWMDENNVQSMIDAGKLALKEFAPTVWEYYEKLTIEERREKRFVI